jgi:hypothetical protein
MAKLESTVSKENLELAGVLDIIKITTIFTSSIYPDHNGLVSTSVSLKAGLTRKLAIHYT